ncbi:oxidoreductase-like domain-containing protein [Phenylobacterium sp.]|uniref:oxidoreductase-like domain-containing protein n=1 Tax=Phenylobacterium sp. TaxID=1871053 RepID=UPI0025DB48FB|nr:oxidoreductase-like domain-containing protein [Phenylobacterium sp.]
MAGEIPRPPDKPQDYECCKRGCCPCIFDYYYDALERWEQRVEALGHDPKEVLKRFPSP